MNMMVKINLICFSYLVLAFLILTITGCDNQESNKQKYPPLSKRFEPTAEFPEGYSDVIMGDYLMRISHQITTNIDVNGAVSLFYIWPEFKYRKNGKSFREPYIQNAIDTIAIFITPPRRGPMAGEPHQVADEDKQRIIKAWQAKKDQWKKSTEFPNFLEIHDGPWRDYRQITDDVIDPFGLPLDVACDTLNEDKYRTAAAYDNATSIAGMPTCNMGSTWPDGHRIRIRFKRKHAKDAFQIYQKVIALHDSFIVNNSPIYEKGVSK